jgi:uncharacterized protein YcbX
MEAALAGIRLFPIKSLDALVVPEAQLLPSGALAGDRRWAMFDGDGKVVNGKRHPGVHGVRARFTPAADAVVLSALDHPDPREREFSLAGDVAPLEAWLSAHLRQPIRLDRNDETGFPDDLVSPGPTVVSTGSIEEVQRWFPELTAESVRRRFRANLEITGVPPFWEDRLVGAAGTVMRFRVGSVSILGTNPCQRCPVPPRDPDTGEILSGFQKRFSDRRRETLPPWAEASRFDHFYRFTVNTIAGGQGGKTLRLGDPVRLPERGADAA